MTYEDVPIGRKCPLYPDDDDLICMSCMWTDSDEFDNENDRCPHDEKRDVEANICPAYLCNEQCRYCPEDCRYSKNEQYNPFQRKAGDKA